MTTRIDTLPLPIGQSSRVRWFRLVMIFVAAVIFADSLFGTSGLGARLRAQQEHRASVQNIRALRNENAVLLNEIHRLRTDPATIEAVARTELGLIRPGELLVVLSPIR